MDISKLTKTQVYEINFVYNKFRTIEAYENKENGCIYFYPNTQFLFIANKDDANTLFPYSKRNYGVFYLHKPSNNMYCSETYYTANKKLIQAIRSIKLQIDLNKRYSSEKICITTIRYGKEIDTSRQFIISPYDSKYSKDVYIFGTRTQCHLIESEWRLNSALRSEAFVKGNGTNKDFLNFFCKKFMFLKTMSKKILFLQNEIVKGYDLRRNNSIRLTRLRLEKL